MNDDDNQEQQGPPRPNMEALTRQFIDAFVVAGQQPPSSDVIQALLRQGVPPDTMIHDLRLTPLFLSVLQGHTTLVQILLQDQNLD